MDEAGKREAAGGALWLVPTPIGNLGDLSPRAAAALAEADVIAAEDTRVTRKLLTHLGLRKPMLSYHEHNERGRARQLLARLREGARVALVSDAGTPLLSDPGYHLVRAAAEAGIEVVSLPGPCAAVAALAGSGLPTHEVLFCGFPPRGEGPRRAWLERLRHQPATLVLYESPHRVLASLASLIEVLGERPAALAWNLSKRGERFLRGTLEELRREIASWEYTHGEMTLVIAGAAEAPPEVPAEQLDRAIRLLLAEGLRTRAIRDLLADLFDLPKSDVYRRVLELSAGS